MRNCAVTVSSTGAENQFQADDNGHVGRPCEVSLAPLLEDNGLLMLLGSRHTTRPAHAGVGGHHTTVSSLFFIAYPQTRVPAPSMLGPYADATGRSLQPMLDCSKPGLCESTNPYPISPDLDPGILL